MQHGTELYYLLHECNMEEMLRQGTQTVETGSCLVSSSCLEVDQQSPAVQDRHLHAALWTSDRPCETIHRVISAGVLFNQNRWEEKPNGTDCARTRASLSCDNLVLIYPNGGENCCHQMSTDQGGLVLQDVGSSQPRTGGKRDLRTPIVPRTVVSHITETSSTMGPL